MMRVLQFLGLLVLSHVYGSTAIMSGVYVGNLYQFLPLGDGLSVGKNKGYPISFPTTSFAELRSLAIGPDQIVILVGQDSTNNNPAAFRSSVNGIEATSITIPTTDPGRFNTVGIGSDGTAYLAGYAGDFPLIYRLSPGENTPTLITNPNNRSGDISALAIDPDGRVLLVGEYALDPFGPLVWSLEPGATIATEITGLPEGAGSFFNAVSIGPDGSAITVGQTSGPAIAFRIPRGGSSASEISLPNITHDAGLNCVAFFSDGSGLLGGTDDTSNLAALYKVPSGLLTAEIIDADSAGAAEFFSLAIDPQDVATLVGIVAPFNPLICRMGKNDSSVSLISLPNNESGLLNSVAVDSTGFAVAVGVSDDTGLGTAYNIPPGAAQASPILLPNNRLISEIKSVVIFNATEPYDINRIKPIYNTQLFQAQTKLNQAGLR